MKKRDRETEPDIELSDSQLRKVVRRKMIEVDNPQLFITQLPAQLAEMPIHRLAMLFAALWIIVWITCG